MAVHAFSVNLDSLSGNMAHNYYLYEYNGKLNIIPWDYDLSFGGMGGSRDASGTINDAIDTPFQGTAFFDALLEDEGYLEEYHEYLRKLTEEYVSGGRFSQVYQRIRSQIDTLVETDPAAFYSGEEYGAAAEMLYETVILRAESIRGQLDGRIPSTDAGQQADASNLVDASSIDIEVMGAFDRGGGGFPGQGGEGHFGRGGGKPGDTENAGAEAAIGGEASPPEGMERPDGDAAFGEEFSPPEGMERPDGDAAFGEEFSPPEGMERPDGDAASAGDFQPPERAGRKNKRLC
nr:CotH kinase family protein [uncultured Acetatifactor sp.]